MRVFSRVAAVVFVVALPVLFITTNVRIFASEIWFYERGMRDHGAEAATGIRQSELDRAALERDHFNFNTHLLLGGQIGPESPHLYLIYPQGNPLSATEDSPYLQVGESKYGKPILDRVLTPATQLDEAAKCALVSMDSTLKSNLSVGLPLDLVVYEANKYQTDKVVCIDEDNPYFRMMHDNWGKKLRQVFDSIEDPMWNGEQTAIPLMVTGRGKPLRKIRTPQEKLI